MPVRTPFSKSGRLSALREARRLLLTMGVNHFAPTFLGGLFRGLNQDPDHIADRDLVEGQRHSPPGKPYFITTRCRGPGDRAVRCGAWARRGEVYEARTGSWGWREFRKRRSRCWELALM